MTDFMRWLYASYVKPQLDSKPTTGYEECLSLMDTCLNEYLRTQYDRTVESVSYTHLRAHETSV